MAVMDAVECLKAKCSQDKEENVLGLGAKRWLFESFVILIYINIHLIHRVWKLYLLHDVLATGTM